MVAFDYANIGLAAGIGVLFVSSFIAATLIPLSSEAVLAGLLTQHFDPALLLIVALIGNTLGAVVNWTLGYWGVDLLRRRLSPFSTRQLDRASSVFARYGVYCLFFSWLPIIGDPLTFAAGVLKVPFGLFLLPVVLGKAARYLVVIAATAHFL